MRRIAELRSHVEMYLVHEVDEGEDFSEVWVQSDNVHQASEGDNVHPNVAVENARNESNSNDDSNNEEFVPSDLEVDSADGIHFTDSEEEYDDDSGFEGLTGVKDGSQVDKGKGVVNGEFSDDEGFNNDELDLEYENRPFLLYAAKMGEETTWQLRSMNLKHTGGQAHRVGIMHTSWLSRAFKKKVEHNPKVKLKELVNKAQRKWNLIMTTSMVARSRQAALDEIQET
ncbi:hypothetical protein Ahy_A09g045317 [Arachis hypogaea]|uniref:Uncharacterized protein n=1 Tax=Arachis hypogaea TaxID=3818 RepID=A0A445BM36_ARAHY|nr:hypothetical protein Ahy_A09g045317 [Arachis hypogaea]